MKTLIRFQAAIFSVLLLATFAVAGDSPDFLVEMKIIDSGNEVATPSMMIKEGAEGSLSRSGEGGFAVGLAASSADEGEVHVIAEVESGQNKMSPKLLVREGEWASVSVGELEFHLRVEQLAAEL